MAEFKEYLIEKNIKLYSRKRTPGIYLGVVMDNIKYRFHRLGLEQEFSMLLEREREYKQERKVQREVTKIQELE